MEPLVLSAYGKINLTLSVTGRRPDGYHLLETVFQRVSLGDRLTLAPLSQPVLILEGGPPGLDPQQNLLTKAWELLRQEAPPPGGVRARLEKVIPVQGGMGGGSADCAAFLVGMNRLWNLRLGRQRLLELGARLGADVPACILGGTALGRGIGEELTPIPSALVLHLAVVRPPVAFSTPEMFRRLDLRGEAFLQRFPGAQAAQALARGDLPELCGCLYNVFEEVAGSPLIEEAKEALTQQGALASLMTGSGSCVFGIFAQEAQARQAARRLGQRWPAWYCHSLGEEALPG